MYTPSIGDPSLPLFVRMGFMEGAVALVNRSNHINTEGCRIPEVCVRNSSGMFGGRGREGEEGGGEGGEGGMEGGGREREGEGEGERERGEMEGGGRERGELHQSVYMHIGYITYKSYPSPHRSNPASSRCAVRQPRGDEAAGQCEG